MSVTSITMIAGGAAVHVTVDDQNGNPLPPADVAWATLPDGITVTPDATGFLFQAGAAATVGTVSDAATYNGPGAAGPVSGTLGLVVDAGVTGLTFTSP